MGRSSSLLTPLLFSAAILSLVSILAPVPSFGGPRVGAWGTPVAVGFHYPGVSARCSLKQVALEGLYMRQDGADAYGPRLYYLFNPGSRVVFNVGGEYTWVKGETDVQSFEGGAMTGFLGMEAFSTRRISVGIDLGFYQVSLEGQRKRRVSNTGLVANLGLHFYL